MITVDKILFRFAMADESFAKGLYANWDEFCQKCFTEILENHLSRYDCKDKFIRMDSLNLNLGNIPQEDFYEEFPRRVRAELEKIIFPSAQDSEFARMRLENLLHYLRYGFCMQEWDTAEFDLFEELRFHKNNKNLRRLCFTETHCMERIIRQLDNWQTIEICAAWFTPSIWDNESDKSLLSNWVIKEPEILKTLTELVSNNKALLDKMESLLFMSSVEITEDRYMVSDNMLITQRVSEITSNTNLQDSIKRELLLQWFDMLSKSNDISKLTEKDLIVLITPDYNPLEIMLLSHNISDTFKRSVLGRYLHWHPKLLWNFFSYANSSSTKGIKSELLAQWFGIQELLGLVTAISISLGNTLTRVIMSLKADQKIPEYWLKEGLIRFIATHKVDDWYHLHSDSVIRDYLQAIRETTANNHTRETISPDLIDIMVTNEGPNIADLLNNPDVTNLERDVIDVIVEPEYISIHNAGLCLLAQWFPRLFGMLGLLNDDIRDFKDLDARIRAVFILQRLVTGEEREYKESDLAFNRLLVAIPFSVPLPRTLVLTDKEVQVVDSMLLGVKANWVKMQNTSVKGFQNSFIMRDGHLVQHEEKWVLNVENRSYDMLLDTLPWSYKTIRLPWLKKRISVIWRDKEDFDFDNINDH